MSAAKNNDSGLEKLRVLADKNSAPALKKNTDRAAVDAQRISREVSDSLARLGSFTSAKNHNGEHREFTFKDKSGRSYDYTFDSDGNTWGAFGYSIQPILNFIYKHYPTQQDYEVAVDRAIVQQQSHLRFHKRLTDFHPIIGTAILLARTTASSLSDNPNYAKMTKGRDSHDAAQWYEQHMIQAEETIGMIDRFFSSLRERVNDTLTESFLGDAQKECELLIAECCYFSFLIFNHFMDGLEDRRLTIQLILKDSPFPISSRDYDERERNIINLRNAYLEYLHDKPLDHTFPMPSREQVRETGEIRLPVYVSTDDLTAILGQYRSLWSDLANGVRSNKAVPFKGGYGRLSNTVEIGVQSGSSSSQDRFSLRAPAFNIRFDKDPKRDVITMDIGSASIDHALACAESFLEQSVIGKKVSSVFRNTAGLDEKSVQMENKMALVASVMMNASKAIGLRSTNTISHHSREYVGKKKEYYDNFTHILASLKAGLERSDV